MKPYKDRKYTFVALLPNEDIAMSDFLSSMNGVDLISLLENSQDEEVIVKTPKFSVEYEILLQESLKNLGMKDAFDYTKSDFSSLAKSEQGNIFISQVIHKTKIEVNEKGTKAGAATAVEVMTGSARPQEPKQVVLDRPFFYMIIDTEQHFPLFMGSLMSVE